MRSWKIWLVLAVMLTPTALSGGFPAEHPLAPLGVRLSAYAPNNAWIPPGFFRFALGPVTQVSPLPRGQLTAEVVG